MALYFLLGTLNQEGQRMLHESPDLMAGKIRGCYSDGANVLGQYAVIGRPDFIIMAEADDNEVIARLSLDIGTRAGLHIETLPAIAVGVLSEPEHPEREGSAKYGDNPSAVQNLPDHSPLPSLTDVYGRSRN